MTALIGAQPNNDPAGPLITCVGEVLIDFLPIVEDGRTVGFRSHPGGSLLNVAVAAARLGARVALATRTGDDFFGRSLRAYAEGEGIDVRWMSEAPARTTLGFVSFEGGEPAYAFYGEGTSDTLLVPENLPDELLDETAILHVGSISLLRGSTPATVLSACERLRGRALLSLDPNVRPDLVRDEPAYRAMLDRFFALVDVVKVSAADLAWLTPGRDIEAVAGELLDRGASLVAVTDGGAGVVALQRTARGTQRFGVPSFQVAVADTVGAGDTFDAGLLTRLVELRATSRDAIERLAAEAVEETLRFAAGVAALNCTRPGADPPHRAEADAFLARPPVRTP